MVMVMDSPTKCKKKKHNVDYTHGCRKNRGYIIYA